MDECMRNAKPYKNISVYYNNTNYKVRTVLSLLEIAASCCHFLMNLPIFPLLMIVHCCICDENTETTMDAIIVSLHSQHREENLTLLMLEFVLHVVYCCNLHKFLNDIQFVNRVNAHQLTSCTICSAVNHFIAVPIEYFC